MASGKMLVPVELQREEGKGAHPLREVSLKLKMAVVGSDDGVKIDFIKYMVGDPNEFLKYIPLIGVGVTRGRLRIEKPDCTLKLTEFLWVLGAGCTRALRDKHLSGASAAAIVVGALEDNPKENAVKWLGIVRKTLGADAPVAVILTANDAREAMFLEKLRAELKDMPEFAKVQFYGVVLNVSQERGLVVHGDLALALGSRES